MFVLFAMTIDLFVGDANWNGARYGDRGVELRRHRSGVPSLYESCGRHLLISDNKTGQ